MLQGFYSHERELMLALRRYYRECDIEVLPFLKDQRNHHQLAEVLSDYAAKIPASDLTILQQLKEMGGLLDA